jgi:hypothetical protein
MNAIGPPSFRTLILIAVVLGCTIGLTTFRAPLTFAAAAQAAGDAAKSDMNRPVAVVELFTSEGCSSCPPADENLKHIAKLAAETKQNVIVLSFHVDYWNRLGWKDPFSSSAFSKRQSEYAKVLKSESVYTPQMIVNGTSEFVGSDRRFAEKAIRDALADPAIHRVELSISEIGPDGKRSVNYKIDGPLAASGSVSAELLNIAVVAQSEKVSVKSGENRGKTLSHIGVVRSLITIPLTSAKGFVRIDSTQLTLPQSRIIGYVQSKVTGKVTGAASLDL